MTAGSARQWRLLCWLLLACFLFLFVRYLLVPGWQAGRRAAADLAEAEAAQTELEETLRQAETAAPAEPSDAAADFYPLLSSAEADDLVTGLVLDHDLQALSLTLSDELTVQDIPGYTASARAGQTAAPAQTEAATQSQTLQRYLEALPADEARENYLRVTQASVRCSGGRTDFMGLLDALADDPALFLRGFTAEDKTYATATGGTAQRTEFTLDLLILQCDRERT